MGIITGNINAAKDHASVQCSNESVAKWPERLALFLTLLFSTLLLPALTADVIVRSVMSSLPTNRSFAPEAEGTNLRGKSASIIQGGPPRSEGGTRAQHPILSPKRVCALAAFAVVIWAGGRMREFGQDSASRAHADVISTNITILSPALATS
ncbi:hypothetical protein BDV93DRAFT_520325 [Ceratobasidium sp. AG-I]|nr:hypothetical protein BDV93DRAFT_520325 [Ceratobasidium sp. AG-I]